MEAPPLGYLVINVLESAGHDSEDAPVWEPNFKEGYARGEATCREWKRQARAVVSSSTSGAAKAQGAPTAAGSGTNARQRVGGHAGCRVGCSAQHSNSAEIAAPR